MGKRFLYFFFVYYVVNNCFSFQIIKTLVNYFRFFFLTGLSPGSLADEDQHSPRPKLQSHSGPVLKHKWVFRYAVCMDTFSSAGGLSASKQ